MTNPAAQPPAAPVARYDEEPMPTKTRTTKKPAAKPQRKITERGGLDELLNMRVPPPAPKTAESPPVSDALDRIACALKSAEDITQVGHRMLEKYLRPLPPNNDGCGASSCTRGQSDFVRVLNEVADRIFADNDARRRILDRLEL